jgi:GNAT superfamily N-acetyltransferase
MSFTVRVADSNDAQEVAELNGVVQQLHHDERPDWFKPPSSESVLPIVDEWLSSSSTALFVACDSDGTMIGYSVGFQRERADSALLFAARVVELDQVVVVPSARERGVGRALATAVINWAQANSIDRVELSTWAFNDTALRLFASLGFTPTVRRMSRSTAPLL